MTPDLMLDLFSGMGGASAAFIEAGWEVVRVDIDTAHPADIYADLSTWSWHGRRPTLVWASPPCTEFTHHGMPWIHKQHAPSMALVEAADRIIRECQPDYWVIENVRGAVPYIDPLYGKSLRLGPVFLWGEFPRFYARVAGYKGKTPGHNPKLRARIPMAVSRGLLQAIMADRAQMRLPFGELVTA